MAKGTEPSLVRTGLVVSGFLAGVVFAISCGGGGGGGAPALASEDGAPFVVHVSRRASAVTTESDPRIVAGAVFTPSEDPHVPAYAACEVSGPIGTLTLELRLSTAGPVFAQSSTSTSQGGRSRVVIPLQGLPETAGPRSGLSYFLRATHEGLATTLSGITLEFGMLQGLVIEDPSADFGTDPDTSDLDNDGFTVLDGDCNDGDAAINPDAVEIPSNGIDDNCDGRVDERILTGPIETDQTLSGDWYVEGDVHVRNGAKLTIASGATLYFESNASIVVESTSSLTALSGGSTILFTSAASAPTAGDWKGIHFYSNDATNNVLDGVQVEYGGGGSSDGNVVLFGTATATVQDSTIRFSAAYGIYVAGGATLLGSTPNTFSNNASGDVGP